MTKSKEAKSEFSKTQLGAVTAEIKSRLNENDLVGSLLNEIAIAHLSCQSLTRELRVLSAQLEMRDILLPEVRKEYIGVTEASLDAGMPFSASQGFHALEYDHAGRPFRWTGPKADFYFNFHLDRSSALSFQMRLSPSSPPTSVRALRCFADRAEIQLETTKDALGWTVSGVLFPREILGLTRIEFVAPETFSPKEKSPQSTDDRLLGVVFMNIKVSPATKENVEAYRELVDSLALAEPEHSLEEDGELDAADAELNDEELLDAMDLEGLASLADDDEIAVTDTDDDPEEIKPVEQTPTTTAKARESRRGGSKK